MGIADRRSRDSSCSSSNSSCYSGSSLLLDRGLSLTTRFRHVVSVCDDRKHVAYYSRPEELDRRKEEARLARACQVRVLPEADPVQVAVGETVFDRVSLPPDQQDDIGRLAREIFGPYIHFLTSSVSLTSSSLRHGKVSVGPGKTAALSNKPAGNTEGGGGGTVLHKASSFPPAEATDASSGLHKQNSTSALSRHGDSLTSTSDAAAAASDEYNADNAGTGRGADSGGAGKRPSSSTLSQHTHPPSANRPAKPPLLRTSPGPLSGSLLSSQPSTTTPQEPTQPSTSSPVNSVLSPCNQKDIPSAPSRNSISGRSRELTPPPPPSSSQHSSKSRRPPLLQDFTTLKDNPKSKTASSQHSLSSSSSLPSSKDRRHQQHISSSPSKPLATGKDSHARVPFSSSSSASSSAIHQDGALQMPATSMSSPSTPTVTTSNSSSSLSGAHHKHSISHSPKHTPSVSMSSTAKEARAKANGSSLSPPPGRPRSATPTKASRPLNGINPALSKSLTATPPSSLSSSSSSSLLLSSNLNAKDAKTGNSVDNKAKLRITMPTDTKKITSKSDLDSIFREMEPLQRHSGIETPQKAGDRFPFGAASALTAAAAAAVAAAAASASSTSTDHRDSASSTASGAGTAMTSKQVGGGSLQSP
ncbi:hypothetical protein ElyMa_001554800 [Elysia marginata]|uniref:Uncharacterized protein n=1 Tax=Elysia marginata TaxID=1093978 RepID=A0AAV4JAL4_9GAST|nr:hypothetical protein ElyMa_001554800 [Elysia marginata]